MPAIPRISEHLVRLRPADADDAPELARLIDIAGGGVYGFLLDGLMPGMTAAEMLTPGLAGRSGSLSHRQSGVAELDGRIVGIAHGYPADWIRTEDYSGLPPDRVAHMAEFTGSHDWGSYFLAALAVDSDQRRRGIAKRLLGWFYERARGGGFDRVTLHVWADNGVARSLYAAEGFEEIGRADIPWHPRLPHHGGSLLLRRFV
ncbi:GNAT family N-acetyltransferase [Azospirillum picis]|uniref:GNAT superfamily N-acetyltransferase n=1 Tax=Azospirillum picis TaxID=488438 RepID=A0ABU0MF16_9PROT|nr:GNAT family N-acetyltransferase [Azospirillum picis]MBP2298003.1 GNAT superfamily N-acetyltransferase [Azospirillum picis]MDQ0531841.1 GNAT superfamily N-acetyltransferase [Azospirillum picis]